MYNIEFYEDSNGKSELWEFLESLRIKAATNKDARIQYKQISLYIQLLEDNGTRLNENITKHFDDDIWEFHPSITVFYILYQNLTHRKAESKKRTIAFIYCPGITSPADFINLVHFNQLMQHPV